MNLNAAGINLVKHFEGCRLKAYPDPGSGGEPITIGWGATGGIKLGDVWTQEEADARLEADLEKVADQVRHLLKPTISDNAFNALVCFAYNVGVGNLKSSSLLALINASNSKWAALEFEKWDHAGGKVMPGLVARRAAEKALFLS